MGEIGKCIICCELFEKKMKTQNTCSDECRTIANRRTDIAHARKKRETIKNDRGKGVREITCICCGKQFVHNGFPVKYCSTECNKLYYKRLKERRTTVTIECKWCGDKFEVDKSVKDKPSYCSDECRQKAANFRSSCGLTTSNMVDVDFIDLFVQENKHKNEKAKRDRILIQRRANELGIDYGTYMSRIEMRDAGSRIWEHFETQYSW